MIRSLSAFKETASRTSAHYEIGDQSSRDSAGDFFIQCYHFKDYLKRHPKVPSKQVETLVSNNRYLSIAADLCNTLKHGELDGPRAKPRLKKRIVQLNMAHEITVRAGEKPDDYIVLHPHGENVRDGDTFRVITIAGNVANPKSRVTSDIVIDLEGEKLSAVFVAEQCMDAWTAFLVSLGLDFSKP